MVSSTSGTITTRIAVMRVMKAAELRQPRIICSHPLNTPWNSTARTAAQKMGSMNGRSIQNSAIVTRATTSRNARFSRVRIFMGSGAGA
jgi:hypothetical protein